ncbi:MAG: hypothetical protein Kow00124_28750 [Anaerolineae bacterium]
MTAAAAGAERPTPAIRISAEMLVYVVILVVAVGVRAVRPGAAPLNDAEAAQALAAWNLIDPAAPGQGTIESPLVFAGAALSFTLASLSDGAARFLPMLGGAALAFTPLLFRRQIGPLAALAACAWLAISPTAVIASRQMTGVGLMMLALTAALAAVLAYLQTGGRSPLIATGAALGFALLADFSAPLVIITLLIGLGFAMLTDEEDLLTGEDVLSLLRVIPWRLPLLGLLVALIIGGALFYAAPEGIGAAADQAIRLMQGFAIAPAGAPYLGLTLAIYEPFLLIFGVIGAWRASLAAEPLERFLAGWGIAAILACLLYRGALPVHGLWAVVPLALLAGLAIRDLAGLRETAPRWIAPAFATGVIALTAMTAAGVMLHLRGTRVYSFGAGGPLAGSTLPLNLILSGLWVALLLVLAMTVAVSWGGATMRRGLALAGLILGLGIASGSAVTLALPDATSPYQPLHLAPAQPGLRLLVQTAKEIGGLTTGIAIETPITVQGQPESALGWALRGFHEVTFVQAVTPDITTPLVIAPAEPQAVAPGSNYVGQDFVITRTWGPGGMTPTQIGRWLIYRRAETPAAEERVILWVREDIYRLSSATPQG